MFTIFVLFTPLANHTKMRHLSRALVGYSHKNKNTEDNDRNSSVTFLKLNWKKGRERSSSSRLCTRTHSRATFPAGSGNKDSKQSKRKWKRARETNRNQYKACVCKLVDSSFLLYIQGLFSRWQQSRRNAIEFAAEITRNCCQIAPNDSGYKM